MKYSKWIGLFAVVILIICAYQPWVYIPAKNLLLSGMQTTGTNFGKPALVNIVMSAFAALFFLVPAIMAKRANVFFCTFNIAWAFRNYIILSICRAGECPEKRAALYIYLFATLLMLVACLFPDVKIKDEKTELQ